MDKYLFLLMTLTGLFFCSCQTTPDLISPQPRESSTQGKLKAESPPIQAPATAHPDSKHTPEASAVEFDYQPYLFTVDEELVTGDHDFGKIPQGKKVSHVFTIQNTTSFAITLGEPRSSISCCVNGKSDREVIEPGGSAKLTVTLDSVHQGGPLTSNVVVPTDGQDSPYIFRTFADVQKIIWTDPYLVEITDTKAEFRVKSERFSKGLKINRTEADSSGLEVTPGKATSGEQTFTLERKGKVNEYGFVRLFTNDDNIPDVIVQYHYSKASN